MLRNRLAKLFLCFVLNIGALCGVPMSPAEIEELLRINNQPVIAQVQNTDTDT